MSWFGTVNEIQRLTGLFLPLSAMWSIVPEIMELTDIAGVLLLSNQ